MSTNATEGGSSNSTRVVSLRLRNRDAAKLERLARLFRRPVGSTAGLLLEEKLREEEFPAIQFRNSALGRQAYLRGHRLSVWEVCWLADRLGNDASRVAEHLAWPKELVDTALAYRNAFPEEIGPLVEEAESLNFDDILARTPGIRRVEL